jgi:hypothetical protein
VLKESSASNHDEVCLRNCCMIKMHQAGPGKIQDCPE